MLVLRGVKKWSYGRLIKKYNCPKSVIRYHAQKANLGCDKIKPKIVVIPTPRQLEPPTFENGERINQGKTYKEYLAELAKRKTQ